MKPQTHLKLQIRELIVNWNYIDSIIFMAILLVYTGFTDPCERCMVNLGSGDMSCKQAFLQKIGYEDTEYGIKKININEEIDNLFSNVTNISIIEP